jgi:arsenite-transporting ATPase
MAGGPAVRGSDPATEVVDATDPTEGGEPGSAGERRRGRPRLILVAGKGGAGKTTLSAATAAVTARRGARTLLVSADAAHSLEDVLLQPLGSEPVALDDRLDGLQLDGRHELQRSWGTIAHYLRRLLGVTELDRLHVDELIVIPGLDQLVALARLRALIDQGPWDAIVVDCAPSADSLRLLALPDVLGFYVDRLFGRNGALSKWARRRIERSFAVPVPDDSVLESVAAMSDELTALRAALDSGATTARIVVTPQRVVIAEAQRTLTYLALYGYDVDAVLVNRVPDPETAAPPSTSRRAQLERIDTVFAVVPRFTVHERSDEPLGLDALLDVGHELYAGRDPLDRLSDCKGLEITSRGNEPVMRLFVPGIEREQIALERVGDELVVALGTHRRSVLLPEALRYRDVARAGLDGQHLEVVFEE